MIIRYKSTYQVLYFQASSAKIVSISSDKIIINIANTIRSLLHVVSSPYTYTNEEALW